MLNEGKEEIAKASLLELYCMSSLEYIIDDVCLKSARDAQIASHAHTSPNFSSLSPSEQTSLIQTEQSKLPIRTVSYRPIPKKSEEQRYLRM